MSIEEAKQKKLSQASLASTHLAVAFPKWGMMTFPNSSLPSPPPLPPTAPPAPCATPSDPSPETFLCLS